MRGEHFLLLAERDQLLAPVVLDQLRRILAQQRRPATGEAVARLLVDRNFLTTEQARRLIEAGTGPGSPLVPQSAVTAPTTGELPAPTRKAHLSEDLQFVPDENFPESRPLAGGTTQLAPATLSRTPVAPPIPSPMIPTHAALAELTDSLKQWMDLPGTLDWNVPPSPIFAPPRWQVTPTMVAIGIGGFAVLFVLVFLVALTRWSAG